MQSKSDAILGLRQFVLINVPNEDGAAFAIQERFNPIPDMGRSIDSSIFVMRHATLYTTGFLNHIGPTLDGRHLSDEGRGIGRHREPRDTGRLSSQRAPYDPSPKILLCRRSRDVAAGAQQAHSQHTDEAPPGHTYHDAFPLLSTVALLPSQHINNKCPLLANERQNRVTLEKLKSRSVIAGTRNLPVSDVMASAGLVKASTRLNTRRGLS